MIVETQKADQAIFILCAAYAMRTINVPVNSVITTCNHMSICKYSLLFQASAWCIIRWNIKESVATTVGLPITERDANFVVSITFCMFNSMVSLDDIWSYHLQSCVCVVCYLIYWQCYTGNAMKFGSILGAIEISPMRSKRRTIRTDTAYTWQSHILAAMLSHLQWTHKFLPSVAGAMHTGTYMYIWGCLVMGLYRNL